MQLLKLQLKLFEYFSKIEMCVVFGCPFPSSKQFPTMVHDKQIFHVKNTLSIKIFVKKKSQGAVRDKKNNTLTFMIMMMQGSHAFEES